MNVTAMFLLATCLSWQADEENSTLTHVKLNVVVVDQNAQPVVGAQVLLREISDQPIPLASGFTDLKGSIVLYLNRNSGSLKITVNHRGDSTSKDLDLPCRQDKFTYIWAVEKVEAPGHQEFAEVACCCYDPCTRQWRQVLRRVRVARYFPVEAERPKTARRTIDSSREPGLIFPEPLLPAPTRIAVRSKLGRVVVDRRRPKASPAMYARRETSDVLSASK